ALPSSTQSFQIHVEFNTPLPFIPQWRLDTAGGSYSGSFSQGDGYTVYDESVAAGTFSGTPVELEIQDDMGAYISGGEIFFDSTEDFTCTALFSPDPPQPYTSLIVTAIYPSGSEPTYKPWVFIDFETVGSWEQEFSQMASMQSYSMTIPSSYITDNVIKIGIGEYPLNEIDCGDNFSIQVIDAVLTVNPDPPDPAVNLDVTATFSSNVPFVPELVIEYSDATMGHYVFTGSPGQLMYQITVPKEDFNALIERIVVEDDQGLEMGDIVFSGPPPFDITNLSTTASDEINVCWTYYDWIDEYKIYFRTASGSYMDGDSPVTVGSSSCYTLGISETLVTNSTYYLKIEAFDAGEFMFDTPEDNITLTTTSVEYPTDLWLETTGIGGEIKVHWDSVSDVDGYYVYYGLGSQNYNESGSPLDVTDPSATQAVISSLNDSNQYFITVEAYIGAVESNNPEEVFGYPGTGGGGGTITVAPADLAISGNPGVAIASKSVDVTNNGMVAVNIRVEPGPLGSISSSHYTIYPLSANIAIGGSNTFTIDLDVPPEVTDGSYLGIIKFYADDGN
ncbi:MAG: fibronectin type III domain-containing protein, partial [Candidatus Omnitrophica bacterium]|nr:fibronectin type III domain-containing protein [Candidatus Omnitrophota bacterium]